MGDTLHGRATYPGLNAFISFEYTVSHGITPGVISFTLDTNQDINGIAAIGDVVVSDTVRSFTIKGCAATELKLSRSDGYMYQLMLYDRRWKWQFGELNGRYNERDAGGKLRKESRLGVWELAQKCFEAMGETEDQYDLGDLPQPLDEEVWPSINWEAENPAKALAELCDLFNCRVVYQPIADKTIIAFAGRGKSLPNRDFTEYAPSMVKPVYPRALRLVGGPLAFMVALALEPVGEELDGSVLPIDELSYKPTAGWGAAGRPPFFPSVTLSPKYAAKGKTLDDCRAAAKKSIWRWYRVTASPINGVAFSIPGLSEYDSTIEIKENWQLVPLDKIIGVQRDENRELYTDPPRVYGRHNEGSFSGNASAVDARVKSNFSVDTARGLVLFDKYIYQNNLAVTGVKGWLGIKVKPNSIGPAEIALVTSCYIRDYETKQIIRYTRDRIIDRERDTPPRLVRRDDIQWSHTVDFKPGAWTTSNAANNEEEISAAADEILEAVDDYKRLVPEQYSYPRVELIDPDGAITQVSWSVAGACTTKASRGGEHSRWMPPYKFQRGQEKTAALLDKAKSVAGEVLKFVGGLNG